MNLFKVKVIELRNAAEVLLAKLLFTAISKTEEFSALEETLEGGWLTDARFQGDEGLASLLKSAGGIGDINSVNFPPELQAVCNVLRAHLRGEITGPDSPGLPDEDLAMIRRSLNAKVTRIQPWLCPQSKGRSPFFLEPKTTVARAAAEALVRYLQFFVSDPDLLEHEPIAECLYCQGIFLIQKKGQRFCKDECRQRHWYAERGKEYYSPLQRAKRQRIRERCAKLAKRPSRRS